MSVQIEAIAHERSTLTSEFGRGFPPDRKPAAFINIDFAPGPSGDATRLAFLVNGVLYESQDAAIRAMNGAGK